MTKNDIVDVVYRPQGHPSQSHPQCEFAVIVNHGAYRRWKDAHGSGAPLVEVCDSMQVFCNPQGSRTGLWQQPSRQQIEDTFGTRHADQVIQRILEDGQVTHSRMRATDSKGFIHPM